jgi:large subunit ribosomal protein L31e
MIMAEDMEERIFIVPLRKLVESPRTKRANKAIKLIRTHVARHMKAEEDHIWIDTPVNEAIWKDGRENPPPRIRVKAIKFKDQDLIEVTMPEE